MRNTSEIAKELMNGMEVIGKFITTVGIIPGLLIWLLWEFRSFLHTQLAVLNKINDALQVLIFLHK